MYQIEQFEEHNNLKESFQQYFNDSTAKWYAPWSGCNARSTFANNTEFNRRVGDFLFSTSFHDLLKQAASKRKGRPVSFRKIKFQTWLNVYESNFFQEPHNHLNKADAMEDQPDICFVYFFDIPDEELFFFLEGDQQQYINETCGQIVFFGPESWHGVDMNPTNQIRRSISGNLWLMDNRKALPFGNSLPTVRMKENNG